METTGGRPAKGSSAMVSRDCLGRRRRVSNESIGESVGEGDFGPLEVSDA